MTDRDASAAAEFRAFVRAHHPDVGGDPTVFAAGLAARGRGPGGQPTAPRITVVPNRALSSRLHRLWRAARGRPSRATPLR